MKAEIIAIGSELTDGAKLDTNSQWLSQQLTDLGVTVHFHTTVADDLTENVDVLRIAVERKALADREAERIADHVRDRLGGAVATADRIASSTSRTAGSRRMASTAPRSRT